MILDVHSGEISTRARRKPDAYTVGHPKIEDSPAPTLVTSLRGWSVRPYDVT